MMGSAHHSKEDGVTRKIDANVGETIGGTLLKPPEIDETFDCPPVARFDLLLIEAYDSKTAAEPTIRAGARSGVVIALNGAAVRVSGDAVERLRECLQGGKAYSGQVEEQHGRRVRVVFTVR